MPGTKLINSPTPYASSSDFQRIFHEDMNGLYLLSFLLTADHEKAEQCFVSGLGDAVNGNRVFQEWARSWARRVIIKNAVSVINPRPLEGSAHSSPVSVNSNGKTLAAEQQMEITAVLGLEPFERFVYVLTVLEGYSDQDCSLLLGCARREVVAARSRALQQTGNLIESHLQRPLTASHEKPVWMASGALHLKTCSTFSNFGKNQNTTFMMRMEMGKPVSAILNRQYSKLGFAAVLLLSLMAAACGKGDVHASPPPAPEVRVAPVIQLDVPVYSDWVATLDGYVNAEIRPQVSGYIVKQNYKEGSLVRRGQVLFEIDPRPFQAALDRAKGDLAQAQAQLGKSTLDVKRDTPLAQARAIAQSQLDNEIQAKLGAQAAVETDQAAIEQAKLNLEWTKIISLVDGIAGIAQVQIGNLVGPNSVLTSVSQVDPIKAYFPISEQAYVLAQEQSNSLSAKHAVSFFGNSLDLILTDGRTYPRKGKILLADRQVDPNTGTIRIVAAFPNPGNVLRPGQYGRVHVETNMKKGALLIPQSAVAQSQGSYQVAVVDSNHKVSMRAVKPGETLGTLWVIDEGLKPGEQIVVEGLAKLKEGTLVAPKPAQLSGEGN